MLTRKTMTTISGAGVVAGLLFVYSCGSSKTGGAGPGTNPDGGGGPPPGNDASSGMDSRVPTGDAPSTGSDTGSDTGPGPGTDSAVPSSGSVLQHHNTPQRDGLYLDPTFSKTSAMALTQDTTFAPTNIVGNVLSQPLYVADISPGKDAVFLATESNNIYSLDATTGAQNWMTNVGTLVDLNQLPCGSGVPMYGISGTPVIDMTTRTLYAESMHVAGGSTIAHQVVALSIDTGAAKPGWPVQINGTTVPGFTANIEHDRGALALVNGILYIPFTGLNGDCPYANGNTLPSPDYHGGLVGIDTTNPATIKSWFTSAHKGGAWGSSGIPSDGTNVYLTTGNTDFTNGTWGGGEAVLRFASGPVFSNQAMDYFAPHDWFDLDNGDTDLGSTGAILITVPGATPSQMIFAGGKGQEVYLISETNMGGVSTSAGNDGITNVPNIVNGEIKTAFAAYTTAMGSYVVMTSLGNGNNCPGGTSGNVVAAKISATNPPQISTAWCADAPGSGTGTGSPMVTNTVDGTSNAVVWVLGAGGSNLLYGFDGDTGAMIFGGGGVQMQGLEHWITPMYAKRTIYVGADAKVYAFQ